MLNTKRYNILIPLIYFDLFDYPLTAVEIWQWQYRGALGLDGIKMGLDEMIRDKIIETKQGFYFLPGKEENVIKRLNRYNIAEEKFKKLKRLGWLLARLPFIKMIAVCNTLAYSNASEDSDIDLFIITAKNRIWAARFWCVVLLKLLGLQPDPKNMKDKFCLSFFVAEDNLNLQKCLLSEKNKWPDIYFLYWLATLYPVYDNSGIFQKLWQENNWLKTYLSFALPVRNIARRAIKINSIGRCLQKFFEIPTGLVGNRFYKWLQLKILPNKLKTMANLDTRVIINDRILKFHDNDRREEIRENAKCQINIYAKDKKNN